MIVVRKIAVTKQKDVISKVYPHEERICQLSILYVFSP